ncbi:hypothetical protein RBXJA2T_08163 [Rubrivivax benzoatilyticus JA2 = ATCC BAA-35]|nr:hypothetical protein RBXJA2T_08163 [Rubrivivax benzoatilyticus JA2 = ATCC BAA-35]
MGLDLLDQRAPQVDTVGTAAHAQLLPAAFERDLALVPGAAARGDAAVASDAFGGRRCRRETQVQVAGLGREGTQRAHRHGVGGRVGRCVCGRVGHGCIFVQWQAGFAPLQRCRG